MARCEHCNTPIDPDRAEFLTETGKPLTCPQHSNEQKKMTLMEYGHKTAGQIVIIPDNPEAKRLALRAYHRSR
jgi:hypothetical protein